MIELIALIKDKRERTLKIKCEHVSYWSSRQISEMIEYMKNNIDKYCIDIFKVDYYSKTEYEFEAEYYTGFELRTGTFSLGNCAIPNRIKSFDIEVHMNMEEYEYLKDNYNDLIEKYYKFTVNLKDILGSSLYKFLE